MSKKMIQLTPRLNPISVSEEVLLGFTLAAAIGGGGYLWYKKHNPSITVAPGTQTVNAKIGGTVTLKLPSGASWNGVANGSAGGVALSAASGTAPYPVTNVVNGEVINATWTDSAGVAQNGTINVVAA